MLAFSKFKTRKSTGMSFYLSNNKFIAEISTKLMRNSVNRESMGVGFHLLFGCLLYEILPGTVRKSFRNENVLICKPFEYYICTV